MYFACEVALNHINYNYKHPALTPDHISTHSYKLTKMHGLGGWDNRSELQCREGTRYPGGLIST